MGPFEPYDPRQRTSANGPAIRVVQDGRLLLNADASRLVTAERVQLLWDEEARRIGLKPTTEDDPLAVRVVRGASQATISAAGFIRGKRLMAGAVLALDEEQGIWVADTRNPLRT